MLILVDKFPIKIGSTQPTCYNIINRERGEIMTIGERLLNLRKEKNISQEELADILGVSRQTISKWELDQTTPDFDKLVPLCEYFGITSDELLTGKKNYVEEKAKDKKTSFAALLQEKLKELKGMDFKVINIGNLVNEKKLYKKWNKEFDVPEFDDDMVNDELAPSLEEGGVILDFQEFP